MSDCIFCKIIAGEIPSRKVYEDEDTLAFLDINPVSVGHTLVVPKKHYKQLPDMDDEDLGKLSLAVKKVAAAVSKAVECEGYNIHQSNGTCAGQVIPHVHFHIIPRNTGDFKPVWSHVEVSDEQMEEVQAKISQKTG